MRKIQFLLRRRRAVSALAATVAAILGMLLITGCGPGGANPVQQLIQQYPWLASLGVPFLQGLLQEYGPDIVALLIAAAAAL